jgi:hypothetical protein
MTKIVTFIKLLDEMIKNKNYNYFIKFDKKPKAEFLFFFKSFPK